MGYHQVPSNSMKFHGTLVPPNAISLSSMGFHGIRRAPLQMTQVFHGIPWNIPWNSMELWDCHFMAFYPGWTSKGYSMEFHGTLESPNKKSLSSMGFHGIRRAPFQMTQIFHGIPWNIPWKSMELWCRQMTYHLVPWNSMEHSMKFHGTLVPPNEVSLSSMQFHGTLRLSFYDLLPWTSKEYSTEFHGTLESPNVKS